MGVLQKNRTLGLGSKDVIVAYSMDSYYTLRRLAKRQSEGSVHRRIHLSVALSGPACSTLSKQLSCCWRGGRIKPSFRS